MSPVLERLVPAQLAAVGGIGVQLARPRTLSGGAAMSTTAIFTNESPESRRKLGCDRRRQVPRSSLGAWEPPADRADPVDVLRKQEQQRIAELLPIRHQRMSASPFAFLRGAAAVMARDLAGTPATGLNVQACGDAHLLNFGIFASPERRLVFDVNDRRRSADCAQLAGVVVSCGHEPVFVANTRPASDEHAIGRHNAGGVRCSFHAREGQRPRGWVAGVVSPAKATACGGSCSSA